MNSPIRKPIICENVFVLEVIDVRRIKTASPIVSFKFGSDFLFSMPAVIPIKPNMALDEPNVYDELSKKIKRLSIPDKIPVMKNP